MLHQSLENLNSHWDTMHLPFMPACEPFATMNTAMLPSATLPNLTTPDQQRGTSITPIYMQSGGSANTGTLYLQGQGTVRPEQIPVEFSAHTPKPDKRRRIRELPEDAEEKVLLLKREREQGQARRDRLKALPDDDREKCDARAKGKKRALRFREKRDLQRASSSSKQPSQPDQRDNDADESDEDAAMIAPGG